MSAALRPVPKYDRCRDWTDEDIIAWADKACGTDKSGEYHDNWIREYKKDITKLRTELHIRICCPEIYDPHNHYRRKTC